MANLPTPHNLELIGPQYAPIETLPLDACTYEYLTGSPLLGGGGNQGANTAIPAGAQSVLIESMGADVRFRGGTSTVAVAAPTADIPDGSAGGWLPAGAAATYKFMDANGKRLFDYLALKSAAGVRLTWFS